MRHFFKPAMLFIMTLGLTTSALAENSSTPGTISIQGKGEISAAPDMAHISSGVVTQAKTAGEALAANTKAMSALIAVLKNANIADRDIQTSNFSVQPQYVYSDQRDKSGYSKPPQIVGYQVSNSVTVRVRELTNLGAVLDQAVTVGANTINNVSFAIENTDAHYDKARHDAIKDAIAKAKLYTDAAEIGLGRILSISEAGDFAPQPSTMRGRNLELAAAPVPVQAGELTYSISISMQWELIQ